MMSHEIAVVFDPDFGDKLCELTDKFHCWVTSSEANDQAIKSHMKQRCQQGMNPLAHGVTEFEGTELTSSLLEDIWDHHGEFSHDPPLSKMKIIGLKLDKRLTDLLEDYDFEVPSTEGTMEFEVVAREEGVS
jgi:hypothetical protein